MYIYLQLCEKEGFPNEDTIKKKKCSLAGLELHKYVCLMGYID